jgi:DNA-3-methyladenine glycosylase I
MATDTKIRCKWTGNDPLMIAYHDSEWGVPLHNDDKLFEFIILEGAQAGLSWSTVLKKRENYRKAFDSFDPKKISHYDEKKIGLLLSDSGIIRNKLKIAATIQNAKSFLEIIQEFGSLDKYLWRFVNNKTIQHKMKTLSDLPQKTEDAELMSKDLLKRGFKFVGPTICYAFMQAVGMVNDHQVTCFRYRELS